MPTGKIGVYTRFFEYANFRLPLSTFLVNVLIHYHIHISQLSVIGAAKVSHFEILCRVHRFEPTVGLFHSLKSWNDRFFRVDAFACPASFSWNSSKSVSKDPFPKSSEFNVEHYATLVSYPAPFHKYLEPFLCLIGISHNYTLDEDTYPQFLRENGEEMDLLSFIQTVDPTKVRVGERQHAEDEPKLLDTTMGCVVPLLPIARAHAESELDASVDRLFDECGSGNLAEQADSASGGHVVGIPLVSEAAKTVVEDVAPLPPKRQRKRKMIVSDAGGPSHPPKKLREDHRTSTGSSVAERESEYQTDSMAGANLRTITAPPRFVISSNSSHHSGANIAEAEVDSFARPSIPLMIVATTVTSTVDPATTIKENLLSLLFLVEILLNVTNGFRLDDDRSCSEMVDEFAPHKFFASIRRMDHDQLFTEFNVGAARQMSLSAEVRMRAKYNIRERRRLNSVEAEAAEAIRLRAEASKFEAIEKSLQGEVRVLKDYNTTLEKEKSELDVKVADLVASVKVREQEAANLDAMVTSVKSQNDSLVDQVHELETSSAELQEKFAAYENCMGKLEEFQNEQIRVMNDKFKKLYVDFVKMALYLEEKFYPHLLTTITSRRWLLTYGVKLAIVKCLHSSEYLSALRVAINMAIKKGMQDGLAAGITYGQEGRVLTDIAAFNPSTESDYISALQELQDVNFSLLAKPKSNKDASTKTLMNRSALRDVFVPLVEPLSSTALEGMEGTFGTAPETTTALSVTFASISSIPPISTDDYDVHADGQEGTDVDGQAGAGADFNPFPNIEDAELDIS
ncbi:hypothetical protein Tco_0800585 [Tanacetum coccineum]|uniref:Transposase (putative) gypsy type domain-containing protein n=1 Tax=Tanacetum coccineum TaxID=301880 RepID=A0ABQ4ZUI9_9ASTR